MDTGEGFLYVAAVIHEDDTVIVQRKREGLIVFGEIFAVHDGERTGQTILTDVCVGRIEIFPFFIQILEERKGRFVLFPFLSGKQCDTGQFL